MNDQLTVAEQPQIKKFNHEMFGELEVLVKDGKEYLPATDVATTLEYAKPHKAVTDHCDEDGALTWGVIDRLGRTQQKKFITIGNVSRLIIAASKQSKNPLIKEKAKQYERWIFDEVIPSIHKHGAYMKPKAMDAKESILANMQVTLMLNQEVTTVKEEVAHVKEDVEQIKKDINERITLDYGQQQVMRNAVNKRVYQLWNENKVDKSVYDTVKKVYSALWKNLKDGYQVNAYPNILQKDFDEAMSFIKGWRPLLKGNQTA